MRTQQASDWTRITTSALNTNIKTHARAHSIDYKESKTFGVIVPSSLDNWFSNSLVTSHAPLKACARALRNQQWNILFFDRNFSSLLGARAISKIQWIRVIDHFRTSPNSSFGKLVKKPLSQSFR